MRELAARLILVLAACLLSLSVSAVEVDSVSVAKADTIKFSELSLESSPVTPVQTEKHFLPVAEYQLSAIRGAYFALHPYAPAHTVEISSLNNRGPPASDL